MRAAWLSSTFAFLSLLTGSALARNPALEALPAHLRPNPFGQIVSADRVPGAAPLNQIELTAFRGGDVSCQLLVRLPEAGSYRLELSPEDRARGIGTQLYREWFHHVAKPDEYIPDALILVASPVAAQIPDRNNRIANQTTAAYWLDFWIPAATAPGTYRFSAKLRFANSQTELPITLHVSRIAVPPKDVVTIDHNSYGTSWFAGQFPALVGRSGAFFESDALFQLIHAYHRVFYEHHGTFHQLGYGHAGKVGPEFAPQLAGSGRNKHIASWDLYDRHYGPLLDGSAFAQTHRGARPIPFVYLPINPEWPASFEWWDEPGYQQEFVNVVSAMEKHFREKGWTGTKFEMFFNHKKRYKGFAWDGDETRFPKDYGYFREYDRLLKLAVPANSPVQFVFRADVSWTMERQWKELAGVVNFWVCGGGMFSWYPYAPKLLKQRGDTLWTYGGTPPISEASSHITTDVLRAYLEGVDGFVRWETTAPGPDPWFHFAGGAENLVYPGDRFGISEPIPSIRLKLERNAVEDLSVFSALANPDRGGLARAFNGTEPKDWWSPRPALADTNPDEPAVFSAAKTQEMDWSNADIENATPVQPAFKNIDSAAWQRVHEFIVRSAEATQ